MKLRHTLFTLVFFYAFVSAGKRKQRSATPDLIICEDFQPSAQRRRVDLQELNDLSSNMDIDGDTNVDFVTDNGYNVNGIFNANSGSSVKGTALSEAAGRLELSRGTTVEDLAWTEVSHPLHRCARAGDTSELVLLLQKYEVDLKTPLGRTPLYLAAEFGRFENAQLLLAHNANPFAETALGLTPCSVAIVQGHSALQRLLCSDMPNIKSFA